MKVLEFPTGSVEQSTGEPVGALYFTDDGSWSVRYDANIPDWHKDQIKEFVEFIYYCTGREEFIKQFSSYIKKRDRKEVESWRRKNFQLIKGEKK